MQEVQGALTPSHLSTSTNHSNFSVISAPRQRINGKQGDKQICRSFSLEPGYQRGRPGSTQNYLVLYPHWRGVVRTDDWPTVSTFAVEPGHVRGRDIFDVDGRDVTGGKSDRRYCPRLVRPEDCLHMIEQKGNNRH
jgi:hypothetical protein